MSIRFEDLSPEYQRQALAQFAAAQAERAEKAEVRSKYGNVKDSRGEIKFDSRKEARRFDELLTMQKAGQIHDLKLQADFTLQEAFTTITGERVRAIKYRADFTYRQKNGDLIVEDVKSRATKTAQYRMKKKLMLERLKLEIVEV